MQRKVSGPLWRLRDLALSQGRGPPLFLPSPPRAPHSPPPPLGPRKNTLNHAGEWRSRGKKVVRGAFAAALSPTERPSRLAPTRRSHRGPELPRTKPGKRVAISKFFKGLRPRRSDIRIDQKTLTFSRSLIVSINTISITETRIRFLDSEESADLWQEGLIRTDEKHFATTVRSLSARI